MIRRVASGGAAVALLVSGALTACGGDDAGTAATDGSTTTTIAAARSTTTTTTTAPDVASGRPYAATSLTQEFRRTGPDGAERVLQTTIWLPSGDGPAPLVAFAHGMGGNPAKFGDLFAALAGAGYAVVAPRFPFSADDATADLATAVADAPNQARDLEHVVAEVRAAATRPGGELTGRIDPTRLAVAGLSLGGGTAILASFSDCCPALRPAVVVAYSPVPFGTPIAAGAAPLLLVHGTDDRTLPYQGSRDLADTAGNQRWFVTLDQGSHSAPYEDSESPFDQLVPEITVDVLDRFLLGDAEGIERATARVAASGNARIESLG